MYNTSQKFKDNIYAPIRKTTGRVTFDISDTTAAGDVSSITTTSESPISVKAQLINKVRSSTYKTATLEQDRFALDGSFSFADDTIANNGELGWSSAVIGSANGEFFDNILGTVGNCEDLSQWTAYGGGSAALDAVNKTTGSFGFKITNTIGTAGVYRAGHTFKNGIKHVLVADIKNGTGTETDVQINQNSGGTVSARIFTSATNSFITCFAKFIGDGTSSGVYLYVGGGSGTYGYIDAIRIYEISDAEYTAIDSMTPTQIAEKYPYQEYRPAITFNFTSNHSSAGLTITFDQLTGEYATDFDMTAYDASNAVIATTSVTGNTNVIATPLGQLYNYRKVSVVIKKWSVPNRRARVMEVDFGIVKQYTDDNLISMNLIEEMDLLTGKVPSAEFKFTVDNSAREFNILNPTGFYKYLQQKQQVIGEIGLDIGNGLIEYIPIGNYLLQEWQSDEGSLTATFTARTNLDNMASFDYENLSATTKTLYQFAVDIFTVCGITNYNIDTALQSINTNTLVKKTNCKDILQMIAIAGCANIYVTRDNKITLKCNKTRKVRYIRDWLNGSSTDSYSTWVEIQAIDASGVNQALGKSATSNFTGSGSISILTDGSTLSSPWYGNPTLALSSVTVDLGGVFDIATINIWHYYTGGRTYFNSKTEFSEDGITWYTSFDSAVSGTYLDTSSGRTDVLQNVVTTPLSPVDTATFDNMYQEPQIALDKPVKRVEVTYWTDLSTSAIVGVNSTTDTLGDTLKLENNTLINTSARATSVANWMFAQLKYRATYKLNWRGNQALELNDVIDIENTYGGEMSAYITRNELDYAGYLQGRVEAKGVVN